LEGGAILNDGSLVVENSTFSGNSGGYGGALQCRNLTSLIHCTFSNNSANYGGAVFSKSTTLTLNNSILAGNTAGGDGGDLLSQLAALAFTGANLVQSIVEDRPTATTTGPAPLNLAPLLAPLGNYGGSTQTMSPLEGSPAIDAGGATALATDQRGTPRPLGLAPDLGAVEVVPGFTNAPIAGLPGVYISSVAWGDYDNDGRLDFLLTGFNDGTFVSQLWRNTGSGFTDVTASVAPGLPGVYSCSVAWGDYDNDGRLDFLLTGSGISQLWRNTGSGFTHVTASIAPGLSGVDGSSVAWGDYDNDGRLDFLITGYDGSSRISQLWRNTGSGFTDVTASVAPGLPGVYLSSVAWGDYDNDGRLDFLLTGRTENFSLVSQLWRNTGSGFTDVTASVAPGLPGVFGSSVAWGDYDNDGRLDFLLTGSSSSSPVSQLWRNTGNGFTNVTTSVAPGLSGVDGSSVAWGDYDNDGRLDLLLAGRTENFSLVSQLWRNTGSGFTNVTASVAPGLPGVYGPSVAWGDYDNDGRLDFLLTGFTNGSGIVSQLWRNNMPLANTPPTAPTNLTVAAGNSGLTFSWNAASDSQTTANGLAYHLRVGTTPGGSDLLAPMAAADGRPRLPRAGALEPARSRTLKGLPLGQPIYWSVQAADTAFGGSPFATERSFAHNLAVTPASGPVAGDTNGDGVVSPAEFAAVRAALGTNELATLNADGYYTEAQVQSLQVGTPLISQVSPGRFRLTLGVRKSTNLTNPFTDFSLATSGSSILVNPDGKLEFEFPATDNAAFFRIGAE
jgi:hypothetical protein